MSTYREIVLATVTDVTVSGNGADVDILAGGQQLPGVVRVFLDVTSLTGTGPTADVVLQGKIGGVYHDILTFAQASEATKENKLLEACPQNVRVKYTLGGTVTDFDATVTLVRG